jgi:multimeric flavodoxin WrbA
MPRLLIVHHTPSPATHAMFNAVNEGAGTPELASVETVSVPALSATPSAVLDADGYVLGTPANLGYMSGALKHFFDTVYYPCLDATAKRPFGMYIHGNDDTDGALLAIRRIVQGLGWQEVHKPVQLTGSPRSEDLEACWELGATVGAVLAG